MSCSLTVVRYLLGIHAEARTLSHVLVVIRRSKEVLHNISSKPLAKMKALNICLVLLLVVGCVSAYTLRDLFQALDEKENEKKAAQEAEMKQKEVSSTATKDNNEDEETVLLQKVLDLLESRKKAKQLQESATGEKKAVTSNGDANYGPSGLGEMRFGPSGVNVRNFGHGGQPNARNFGPQGGPDTKARNLGPFGKPDTGENLRERNFGLYGRELENLNKKGFDDLDLHGLEYFERNFGAYGRKYLRTIVDDELEKLLAKTKSRQ